MLEELKMDKFIVETPSLSVTNPILLWLFKHGWEDPNWGRLPTNQVALGLILNELSHRLANPALREQVASAAQKIVAENAQAALR